MVGTPPRTSRVRIFEDVELHVEESGHGDQNIVFIPGLAMSTEVFSKQLSYFQGSNVYRFITYDPRGHGLSTKTWGGHFYEQHGRDLNALIEFMNLDRIVLCGWSFGVFEALAYIDQFGTDRLSGLIMLDGPPKARGADNQTQWVTYRYDDADGFEELFTVGFLRDRATANVEFAMWMLEEKSESNISWVCEISDQTPSETASLLNAAGAFLDYSEVLRGLDGVLPLLYVVSESVKDVVFKWRDENTPSARVEAFGKHLMFWERPDEFNDVLLRYLSIVSIK